MKSYLLTEHLLLHSIPPGHVPPWGETETMLSKKRNSVANEAPGGLWQIYSVTLPLLPK